ncbi:MAG: carbon-nitrogen hydrolase family protein [Bilifractor sp.]
MRIAQIQSHVYADKQKNLDMLAQYLNRLEDSGVDLVTIGEMFTTPYETSCFPAYAEPEGGESWQCLADLARTHRIYLSAGTIPEVDAQGHVYNTAYVFDREGRQIAKHRKVHLFDIDVEGGQHFRESDTLTAGNTATVFDTEFCRMGLCICFDCRFPEIVREMVLAGAKLVLVPASFNMTTGPAHWELMFRSRALDNQCYMVGTSDARDPSFSYVSWGHSIVTSPWGDVVAQMDEKEGIQITDLDLPYVDKVRRELPLLRSLRS